jgi:hypothetical protein
VKRRTWTLGRSGRIDDARLAAMAPRFMARYAARLGAA